MRHFLPLAVPTLPLRMGVSPGPARLVPTTSRSPRLSSRHVPALLSAVPMAAIAVATEEEELAARRQGTGDESQRVHGTRRAL
jgi:hypothetical protein